MLGRVPRTTQTQIIMKQTFYNFYRMTLFLLALSFLMLASTKRIAADELNSIICDIRSNF